jgi:hypothetical protein
MSDSAINETELKLIYNTMKHLALILMLSLIFGCSISTHNETTINNKPDTIDYKIVTLDKLPQRGDILPDSIRFTSMDRLQMVSSSTISKATTIAFNSYKFEIAWTNDGIVNYVATYDKSFITPENIRISTTLKEIKEMQDVEIGTMPGWGYFINLESGWNVAFCVDKTCTGREIVDSDSVKWIYK